MPLTLATTAGLVVWIVLWSIGAKAFDAFMLTTLIVVVTATGKIAAAYLPGREG